ncbi:MAG: AmmeMemoRadiSam system radical SAM enzyme [Phycisphaerales bacterium]|nr:MAG: AmmeMemoRadiSam system radical SAM enzyme [Phycisphaerales bacterium]
MDLPQIDRRSFLAALGHCAGGACFACALSRFDYSAAATGDDDIAIATGLDAKRQIDFYTQLPDNHIQCFVCPLDCNLADGETCFCRTRTNVGGKLYTRGYNNPCIIRVDPIEKLPLTHFRPGSETLTLSVGGCNVRCLYCQNWQQSQSKPDELKYFPLTPKQAVAAAKKKNIRTIAFTYTETVAWLEWAHDVAVEAKKAGISVVVATSAYIKTEPLLDFAQYVDGFVVGLKGFTEDFYKRILGIQLAPVLEAIKTVRYKTDSWLELVNLVVPGYNDSSVEVQSMVQWVHEELGDGVPLHFSRFVPMYRLANVPRTPAQTLEKARSGALRAGLKHVYIGNLAPHDGNNTYCPKCGCPVIERLGFKILKDTLRRGMCPQCKTKLPGVWT